MYYLNVDRNRDYTIYRNVNISQKYSFIFLIFMYVYKNILELLYLCIKKL